MQFLIPLTSPVPSSGADDCGVAAPEASEGWSLLFPISSRMLTFLEMSSFLKHSIKGHDLRILKSLAYISQIRGLQSVLIFSILNHPCSFMVCYYVHCVSLFFYLSKGLFSRYLQFKSNFVRD